MKNTTAPGISLAIVLFAAAATVALWAVARRQGPRWLPGTEPEAVSVTSGESRPRPAVIPGTHDGAGHEMPKPPGTVEQMQYVFHELHPYGRNALCVVCDGQYRSQAT